MSDILEFLQTNIDQIIIFLITIFVTTITIPLTKVLSKYYNIYNKSKSDFKTYEQRIQEMLMSVTVSEEKTDKTSKSLKDENTTLKTFSPKINNITYVSPKRISLYELYEKRNTDKFLKKVSFTIAVIMSIIGTIILFIGIIISLFSTKEIGWITTSSGAIIEVVASIYFWLLNRTMKEVKDNSKQLEKTEDLLTAIELVEKIDDTKTKDETYKNMIDKLLSPNNK